MGFLFSPYLRSKEREGDGDKEGRSAETERGRGGGRDRRIMDVGAVRGDIIGGPSPLIPDASCPHHRIPPPPPPYTSLTGAFPAHQTPPPPLPPPSDDFLLSRTQADPTAAIGVNQFSGKESTRSNSIVSDWGKPKNGSKGSSSAWVK